MIDGHIHIERGEYTLDWINQFANKAVEMQLDEIRLLEHCYRFEEFEDSVSLAKGKIFDGISHPDAINFLVINHPIRLQNTTKI